jgi:protein-glutamine gamma-glutamyltransferase
VTAALARAGQAALLVGLVLSAWSGLYAEGGAGRLGLLCALAALPAAARLRLRPGARWAVAPLAAACAAAALAVLAPVPAGGLLRLDPGAWRALARALPDGLQAASAAAPPFSAASQPAIVALLDAALAVLVAALVWQVVVRARPLAGLALAALAVGYRWTVLDPVDATIAGAAVLGVALAALAVGALGSRGVPGGPRGRGARGALAAGLAVVAVAAGLGGGLSRGSGWLDWESWRILGGDQAAAAGGLRLGQVYGQLSWPEEPRVIVRLRAERSLPLRAATLDAFDGTAFTLGQLTAPRPLPRVDGGVTLPVPADAPGDLERQRITMVGAESDLLLAGGRPLSFSGFFGEPVELVGAAVRLGRPLRRGQSYSAMSLVPEVDSAALALERRYRQEEVDGQLTAVIVSPRGRLVWVPPWGSDRPRPTPEAFGRYAGVARLARQLALGATSPYEVVSRIERDLRLRYRYDERPPLPPEGEPPLVDFLLHSRRGFCQHFAGAMALMLRMNGIPARVAVGYTNGDYDPGSDSFLVLDRDAHSWVEVLFPRSGWLPFDPTPGRSVPNPASASSPDFALPSAAGGPGGSAPRLALPEPAPPADPPAAGPEALASAGGGGIPSWLWAIAAAAAALCLPAGARRCRRARRRRRGDERARVLGALRELEGRAVDLGVALPPTLSPLERCGALRARLGIDPERLYRAAAAARFALAAPEAGAARAAWAELRRLERSLRRQTGWRRRARAAVSLTSLAPSGFPSGRRARATARAGAASRSRAAGPSGTPPGIPAG